MSATTEAYTSVWDVPVDTGIPADQGDAGAHGATGEPGAIRELATAGPAVYAATQAPHIVVPFQRAIKLHTAGKDVIGAKRAIWKANGLGIPKRPSPSFGPAAVKQLQKFQHAHGIKADGVLGENTLRKLGPFFDGYAFLLYEGYPPSKSKAEAIRNRQVAYFLWAYAHRAQIHYLERRPIDHEKQPQHLPVWEDCSGFFTKSAFAAGYPSDPNGLDWNGQGYTGTLSRNGKTVSISKCQPGDAAFYFPPWPYGHVVGILARKGTDVRVCSHGSEGGPFILDLSYRNDFALIQSYL